MNIKPIEQTFSYFPLFEENKRDSDQVQSALQNVSMRPRSFVLAFHRGKITMQDHILHKETEIQTATPRTE